MDFVDPRAFVFAMSKISDGFVFERFAQELLSQVLGSAFIPVGGVGDKGIDGLEYCFTAQNINRTIYQMSIEREAEPKIRRTIERLRENSISCSRLFYVTNRSISNEHDIIEHIFVDHDISLTIYDVDWLRTKINTSEGTVRTYLAFADTYCHEFISTPLTLEVADLVSDPRVFVYLRQYWEGRSEKSRLDELLADTIILIGLDGTDPEKGILRTEQELVDQSRSYIKFPIQLLESTIHARLDYLSRKPIRRIRHHSKENNYCLPYETRFELQQKQLSDAALQDSFLAQTEERLEARLKEHKIRVRDGAQLITSAFNGLFREQGIEFASFILNPMKPVAIEKSLAEIISKVVDDSPVVASNKDGAKQALLGAIREIVYKGTPDEIEYLRRLSSSYMMLFLLRCDPKVALFFSTMASHLRLLVDNSLLVPAISEFPLAQQNRRHWNLLKKAQATGVKMYITRPHLTELAVHLLRSVAKYDDLYKGQERFYRDETTILYVEEILIRSYLYARIEGMDTTYEKFIDNFVSPEARDPEHELLIWLNGTFGIELLSEKKEGIQLDPEDLERVVAELSSHKDEIRARSDAHTILAVIALREFDSEKDKSGPFGYHTWWLSKDTTAQRAAQKALGEKYSTDICMRADFLNNYIALSPNIEEINRAFDAVFPTIVGVSIAQHVPPEICVKVQQLIKEHGQRDPARVTAIIGSLADKIKVESLGSMQKVELYLDQKLEEMKRELKRADTTH